MKLFKDNTKRSEAMELINDSLRYLDHLRFCKRMQETSTDEKVLKQVKFEWSITDSQLQTCLMRLERTIKE